MTDHTPMPQHSAKESQPQSLQWWISRAIPPLLFLLAGIILIAAIGVAHRMGWISSDGSSPNAAADEAEVIYTCPMHPQIRQPGQGRCPICGMALVPATTSLEDDLDALSIQIEPAQRRLANIQTTLVKSEPVFATIRTVGAIAIDESRLATIASYIDGRIERLFADYTGVTVAQGDHLAVIYSPELFSAQVEYLENRKTLAESSAGLAAVRQAQQQFVINARLKLQELGLTEDQIRTLETNNTADSRQTIYAPQGGTVIEKLAVEGGYVKAGEPIYRIADLTTVWLKIELFPEDAARIRFGQLVEARLSSIPERVFRGRVAFIDPTVNEKKRSVGVRVEFLNEDGQLRPGDYADAVIFVPIGQQGEVYDAELAGKWISPMHPQIIRDAPGECPICGMELVSTSNYGYATEQIAQPSSTYVPRSALLMAGKDSVVYVETETNRFELRPVTLGPLLRDRAIIVDGLEPGEKVATAGNFLIDSQMQLAGKPSLIDPTRAVAKQQERTEPLDLPDEAFATVGGELGNQLETLYRIYFRMQNSLAADQRPTESDANELRRISLALSEATDLGLSSTAKELISSIARHSEHIHHLEIDQARHDAFRPISHAIVKLASLVRSDRASEPFHQMFCPMVKGGSGDWLQQDKNLLNPYWGSQMLTCGELVRTLPPTHNPAAAETETTNTETAEPVSNENATSTRDGKIKVQP